MSFLPKAAGTLAGGVLGGQMFGGSSPVGTLAGGVIGGGVADKLLGTGKKDAPVGATQSPYYKPQMDANGNPIAMRSGRGAKALSV